MSLDLLLDWWPLGVLVVLLGLLAGVLRSARVFIRGGGRYADCVRWWREN